MPDLDQFSSEPRYRQLAAIMREAIDTGQIKAGEPIPSQTTLMQTYGVARMTASKAVRVLIDEGRVVVVPGMGTFVKPQER